MKHTEELFQRIYMTIKTKEKSSVLIISNAGILNNSRLVIDQTLTNN